MKRDGLDQVDAVCTAAPIGGQGTFVVRVLPADESGRFQGLVQDVHTRHQALFASRQNLLTFIQNHLQDHLQPGPAHQCPG